LAPLTRNEFMKCCAGGLCSCLAVPALAQTATEAKNPEAEWLKEQIQAIRIRYAKLVGILDRELDPQQKEKVFLGLGRECADQFRAKTIDKYKGDLDGFLKSIQGPDGWVAKVETGPDFIRITDRSSRCTCPMVDSALTPPLQCTCTLAWQKTTYSAILCRPVEAELEESILRGGKRCVFRIKTA
jgi:hypothetical protein